jgi:hypothetical protein
MERKEIVWECGHWLKADSPEGDNESSGSIKYCDFPG